MFCGTSSQIACGACALTAKRAAKISRKIVAGQQ
jgi:hypothetical protein